MNRPGARSNRLEDRAVATAEREAGPDPIPAPRSPDPSVPAVPEKAAQRWLYVLWALGIAGLFCLHFPHLLADFPNHSPWMDYSKYTDEGWYGNAAIRYYFTGHWYLHGDFNPAVALPVWPLLLALVFHFTGVSLTAARALALVFVGFDLVLGYGVVRTQAPRWVALLAITLLVSSPFLWAFSRLAILEPLLIFFLLLSWLLALRLPGRSPRAQRLTLICIGLVLCLMVLAKTTAIFVIPSTLFLIGRRHTTRRSALRALGISAAAAALPWCGYYFLLVRPHYRVDYQYLFEANHWPQPTSFVGWLGAFWWALHGSLWMSPTLYIVAIVVLLITFFYRKAAVADSPEASSALSASSEIPTLWRSPLTSASLIAAAGYVFFAGWHNSPQPRYYETVLYPLCFVLALGTADLLRRAHRVLRLCGLTSLIVLAVVATSGVFRIAGYLRHPDYTFLNAAEGVTRYIGQHPGPPRLLLSVSGDDIQLMTGQPAICDDYGTWDLPYRMHTYQPGWYAAWNELDPGTLSDIQSLYSLEPVARFPAFDDPDRNLLILYRLRPLPAAQQTYFIQGENADNANR